MAAVAKKCYYSNTSKIILFDFYSSHLYTDCDSRLRHIPSTNYAEKKRKEETIAENAETEQRVKSPEAPVSPRISSPHRMSEEEKLANKTPTGGNILN